MHRMKHVSSEHSINVKKKRLLSLIKCKSLCHLLTEPTLVEGNDTNQKTGPRSLAPGRLKEKINRFYYFLPAITKYI